MALDAQVPQPLLNSFLDNNRDSRNWTEETKALLNPSIEAIPLHTPQAGKIKRRLNNEYEYFWARDLNGQSPDHTRVQQLIGAGGWQFATTDDVEMAVKSTVMSRTEIRNGDTVLLKIPKQRWHEIRKQQNIDAINLAFPQKRTSKGPMSTESMVPGVRTEFIGDGDFESAVSRARVSSPTEDIQDVMQGLEPKGNAAVVDMKPKKN